MRKRPDSQEISLFPFLSVMACAMGALIVIISAQSVIAVGGSDQLIEIGGGTASDREPVFVECDAQGIIIHPAGERVPLASLYGVSSRFSAVLDECAASSAKYVVFLVRPNGIATYQHALARALQSKVSVGKDALLPVGRVVFTMQGRPVLDKKGGSGQ